MSGVDTSRVTALTIVTMQTIQVMLFLVSRPGQQDLLVNVTAWDQMIMNNVCCNVDCGVVIRHQTCQRTIADCSNNNNNPSSLTIDNASAVFGTRTRDYRATV